MRGEIGHSDGAGVGLGARTAFGRVLSPLLLDRLDELGGGWHLLARGEAPEAGPERGLLRLQTVHVVAKAPWHLDDQALDHGVVRCQEEDQLATCHAGEASRSKRGRKGAQLGARVSTELPLRDGSNRATITEQAGLDEFGLHPLGELGGHLLQDGGAKPRAFSEIAQDDVPTRYGRYDANVLNLLNCTRVQSISGGVYGLQQLGTERQ